MTPIADLHCRASVVPFVEIQLAGSASALSEVAALITTGGEVQCAPGSGNSPYLLRLDSLRVRFAPGERVRVHLSHGQRALEISGDASRLDILAANIREVVSGGQYVEHLHIEYFPDHYYLAADSSPLVVQLEPPMIGSASQA
jgi:hypothetical protein